MEDHFFFILMQTQKLWYPDVDFVGGDPGRRFDVASYVVGVADIDYGNSGGGRGGEQERGEGLGFEVGEGGDGGGHGG